MLIQLLLLYKLLKDVFINFNFWEMIRKIINWAKRKHFYANTTTTMATTAATTATFIIIVIIQAKGIKVKL